MRALAGRSAAAAKEIKTLIAESVEKIEVGARQAVEAGESMNSIVERVGKVSQMMGEISSGAAVQSDGIGQVGPQSQSLKTPQQMRISGKRVNVSHACGLCVEQQWNNSVRGLPEVHFARCGQPASCLTNWRLIAIRTGQKADGLHTLSFSASHARCYVRIHFTDHMSRQP